MTWEHIRGWFSFSAIYDEAVAAAKDSDTLVEVGVAYGKSLAYLARKAIDAGCKARIIGVDPWIGEDWDYWDASDALVKEHGSAFAAFEGEMAKHAPEERARVEAWRMVSTKAAMLIAIKNAKSKPPLSFVWIDAVHDKAHVLEDIAAWMPLIRPGGMIGGHDHTPSFPGVEEAVREAFPGGYEVCGGDSWLVRL